ncbi:MAG: hypothetical protein LBC65_01655, partial [Oscillospiraceae bacterium]|nr:hypothetical protein [Oscillospiraceae bacterium]
AATAFGGCRYNSHYTQALLTAYGGRVDERVISRYSEGLDGVIVEIKDNLVAVGGRMLMDELKVETGDDSLDPDILYIAVNSRYAGRILLASTLREGASDVVYQFQSSDIRTIMFTDEDEITGKAAARSLGFDKCYPSRSYESKLHLVSEPRTGYAGSDKRLLDASGAGIKMTEPGPELLNASADSMPELTVFNSNPARIADAHKLSRQIRDASNLNFAVQLGFKTAGVILSFIGLLPFWAAIAIESGVKYICSARKI